MSNNYQIDLLGLKFPLPVLRANKKLKEFEKSRHENAEVLGWKLTGTPDIKVEIGKLTEFIMKILKD